MDEVRGVVSATLKVWLIRFLSSVKITRIYVLLHFCHYIDSSVFLEIAREGAVVPLAP